MPENLLSQKETESLEQLFSILSVSKEAATNLSTLLNGEWWKARSYVQITKKGLVVNDLNDHCLYLDLDKQIINIATEDTTITIPYEDIESISNSTYTVEFNLKNGVIISLETDLEGGWIEQ